MNIPRSIIWKKCDTYFHTHQVTIINGGRRRAFRQGCAFARCFASAERACCPRQRRNCCYFELGIWTVNLKSDNDVWRGSTRIRRPWCTTETRRLWPYSYSFNNGVCSRLYPTKSLLNTVTYTGTHFFIF